MGHRVYRAKDPRSIVMEEFLQHLSENVGDRQLYDKLKNVETTFRRIMEEKGKPIYPNVWSIPRTVKPGWDTRCGGDDDSDLPSLAITRERFIDIQNIIDMVYAADHHGYEIEIPVG